VTRLARRAPGGRRDQAQATVYQKHRPPPRRGADVWGLMPAQCRKVKGRGDEPRAEAPVNGGRNYNGPKVAKFLVG
jgi:hypothetical protein